MVITLQKATQVAQSAQPAATAKAVQFILVPTTTIRLEELLRAQSPQLVMERIPQEKVSVCSAVRVTILILTPTTCAQFVLRAIIVQTRQPRDRATKTICASRAPLTRHGSHAHHG